MVTQSGERNRSCGVLWCRLKAVCHGCKGRRQSSGLRGNRGSFECGAQCGFKVGRASWGSRSNCSRFECGEVVTKSGERNMGCWVLGDI